MRFLHAVLLAALAMATVIPHAVPPLRDPPMPVWRSDLLPGLQRAPVVDGLGPFTLAGAWHLHSPSRRFGNYSALGTLPDGTFVALSDRSTVLTFTRPDRPGPWYARVTVVAAPHDEADYSWGDGEALIVLPGRGDLLMIDEGTPELFTYSAGLRRLAKLTIPALDEWSQNQGPEASALLADGRTVMVQEGYARRMDRAVHGGFIFAGVPRDHEQPRRFQLAMPAGFRPTELARLPDGRLLVLGRKFTLAGFRSLIGVVNPAAIRPGALVDVRVVAHLADSRLRDNYEGMTVTPEADGRLAVWLISDSNDMVLLQRTLLLKLVLDPARL